MLFSLLFFITVNGQQISFRQIALYSVEKLELSSSTSVTGGSIVSKTLIKTTGNSALNANLHSDGRIDLANSNTVDGIMTAAASTGTVLQVGSNAKINNKLDANGNIIIDGGTVQGPATYPEGASYSGPTPTNGAIKGTPSIPVIPSLPAITGITNTGTRSITKTDRISPGSYIDLAPGGNQTITFYGAGTYIFNSIKNSGNFNNYVFDFRGNITDLIKIVVIGDVDLYKLNISFLNGGDASRIYMEVRGNGSTAADRVSSWSISNGASGSNRSTWQGTVYAPNGNINVGQGSSEAKIIGALWSGKSINIQSGVGMNFVPLKGPNANAGPDKQLTCTNQSVTLVGSSTAASAQYSWSKVDGTIEGATNTASITVSSKGTYVLSVSSPGFIVPGTDTVVVTSNSCVLPYYPSPVTGKNNTKIGAELTSLYQNFGNVLDDGKTLFIIVGNKVLIDVIVKEGFYSQVLSRLQSTTYEMTGFISNGPNTRIITGLLPISKLNLFDTDPNMTPYISFVRPSFPPLVNSGIINSAGDTAMQTHLVRNGFNLSGEGVKIGVLSDSYSTLSNNDVANKDLPGSITNTVNPNPVQVLQDYPYGTRSDEGRAMLQIIHDVAPKARLAFRTGFITPGDMAVGIQQLADAGCNGIVDDVTYITEPFFKPGVIARKIAELGSAVHYVTAAGNFGVKSYEANFVDGGNAPFGIGGRAHNFGTAGAVDLTQRDSVKGTALKPGIYTVVLQWDDEHYSQGGVNGTTIDLDAYAADPIGNLIGFNRINFEGDPTEVLTFVVTENTVVDIMVVNATPAFSGSIHFKYVVFRGDLKILEHIQGSSTIIGQGNAPEAITVGATFYGFTPAFGVTAPLLASSYSSVGGGLYNGTVSNKPDIVAPTGVNTSVPFGSIDPENDNIPNFFGTSAAAPHVAGAIALVIEGRRRFYGDALSRTAVKSLLTSTAINMDDPGFDFRTGYGLVQVEMAMRTLANPTPQIDNIQLADPRLQPGLQPVQITVNGNYLSTGTKIFLGTQELPTSYVSTTQVNATLPAFGGDSLLRAFTNSITPSGLDGGYSNSLSITGYNKKNIVVKADNKTRKYGEKNPGITFTVTYEGGPLPAGITLQDLGLGTIKYQLNADSVSNVGLYAITPLSPFDSTNTNDILFLNLYRYRFEPGVLNIGKMPLTIVADNKTVNYGDYIGAVTFAYQFNEANVSSPAALRALIKTSHRNFLPDNALAVVNGFSSPLSNGSTLSFDDLANLSMMTTFQAIKNSRQFQIVNNQLVPVTNTTSTLDQQYILDISAQSIYNYKTSPSSAPLVGTLPGLHSRAILGATSIKNAIANISQSNGSLVQVLNGSLVPVLNTTNGSLVPVLNGSLVQVLNGAIMQEIRVVNGSLVQVLNGSLVPVLNGQIIELETGGVIKVVNGSLVQVLNGIESPLLNGSLVQVLNGIAFYPDANGVLKPIPNGSLVQVLNGSLVQVLNGSLVQVLNGTLVKDINGSLVPVLNGSVQLVNGSLVQVLNGSLVPVLNSETVMLENGGIVKMTSGSLVQVLNGSLVQVLNGSLVQVLNGVALYPDANGVLKPIPNGSLVQVLNGSLVQVLNGSLVQVLNGSLVPVLNGTTQTQSTANTAVILDSDDIAVQNGSIGSMFSVNMITGLTAGTQKIIPGAFINENFQVTYVAGTATISKKVITITARDTTKLYAEELALGTTAFNVTGDLSPGETIAGATLTSAGTVATALVGTYDINIASAVGGAGTNLNNYTINYVKGKLTVNSNPCLIVHSPSTNFGSTANPGAATSLWLNIVTKVSGQLVQHGDFVTFNAGAITFNNITYTPTDNTPEPNTHIIPRGKIIADNSVTAPETSYDFATNSWTTKIPPGFSSTSDIFIAGAIINSSTGFVKRNKANTVVKGIFYSNKNFSDQWSYAIAAYQPVFSYTAVAGVNNVIPINGSYRAGTPINILTRLVNGGSGGGGNNYTGSTNSFEKFFTCVTANQAFAARISKTTAPSETMPVVNESNSVAIYPNPASNNITISLKALGKGNLLIKLYDMNGRLLRRINAGNLEKGKSYSRLVDVQKLGAGVYLVLVEQNNFITTQKLVIAK